MFWSVLLIAAYLMVGLDISARLWMVARPEQHVIDFLRSRPAPYRDAPYWSDAFMAEQWNARNSWHFAPDGQLVASDLRGRWYTYQDGHRVTPGNPAHWQHTLWMF